MALIDAVAHDLRMLSLSAARNSQTVVGKLIRRAVLRRALASCGEKLWIGPGSSIIGPQRISIGDRLQTLSGVVLAASGEGELTIGSDCSFNSNAQVLAGPGGRIALGDGVLLGPNAVLRNCDHRWRDPSRPIREQGHECRDIDVRSNVWIAANAVILGGVTLLEGTVVGAGAVVRRGTYGPRALLVGNPAQVAEQLAEA